MSMNAKETSYDNPVDVLHKFILELTEEKEEYLSLLKENEAAFSECNAMIKELDQKTDRDLPIFSPRTNGSSAFEKLEEEITRRDNLEYENEQLTASLNKCNKRIHSLEELFHVLSTMDEFKPKFKENKDYGFRIENLTLEKKQTVLDIQEKERQRIARDLHDTSLQTLIHLIHKLELCSKYIDVDPIQAKLEIASCNKHLKELINDSRNKIFNLRPMSFDDLGFSEVIRRLQINLQEHSNMEIEFNVQDISTKQTLVLITVFRIIQEACNNAIKHSEGTKLTVFTHMYSDHYFIRVSDNGKGFSQQSVKKMRNHFGMAMLEEQVKLLSGTFLCKSDFGKGTLIEVKIPSSTFRV